MAFVVELFKWILFPGNLFARYPVLYCEARMTAQPLKSAKIIALHVLSIGVINR